MMDPLSSGITPAGEDKQGDGPGSSAMAESIDVSGPRPPHTDLTPGEPFDLNAGLRDAILGSPWSSKSLW
jgi:hypothetical protein